MSSVLFVPATDEHKYVKANQLACTGIVLDLEDAVHASQKNAARSNLLQMVTKHRNPNKKLYVRINSLQTVEWEADLDAVAGLHLDGVIVPKADRDIKVLDQALTDLEEQNGITQSTTRFILILETARAVVDMEAVLSASKRVDSATIGMADLSQDLGTSWEDLFRDGPSLLLTVREQLALVSRKLCLSAPWDSVYMKVNDTDGLRKDTLIGKRLGFQGKHVIHPLQIETVNDVYRFTEEEYAKAKEILQKMEGKGALKIDGMLIDEPIIRRARQIVASYEEAVR
ncbi:HpcH/HpaI aldolase/citrate lyase family protein [Alicyclobacillus mengziensis]|uniref:CoA ester lyase n=1 Tax=Alicyclobacillus mengziensis TaxID=2931921 RepID=A0A9X7VY98_9BACL|nr:CoA ester lyase [Alicyclobacillus mengziensis]QSO47241.1 CoA ester lyase [Alicyclobacillus mengziensis]